MRWEIKLDDQIRAFENDAITQLIDIHSVFELLFTVWKMWKSGRPVKYILNVCSSQYLFMISLNKHSVWKSKPVFQSLQLMMKLISFVYKHFSTAANMPYYSVWFGDPIFNASENRILNRKWRNKELLFLSTFAEAEFFYF